MPDVQIFKATYSGVPVYEMMCKGVAVMRRRSDGWLNATQILKVAGFDKPQRTRVLEREVQKGEHEKVQGGYGKYQGTWIPPTRGLALAKQYKCDELLRAIIQFQPAEEKSPPLAPKHLVAQNTARPVKRAATVPDLAAPRAVARRPPSIESDVESYSGRKSDDGTMTPSPSEGSSSSRTPSPIESRIPSPTFTMNEDPLHGHRNKRARHYEDLSDVESIALNDPRSYADQILEYFIADTNQIPELLISPPADFDPDMPIDDDYHTALHWACAMGRLRVVKLLLSAGCDIFKVNKNGQTALMRSVMFANNYDVRKFPELYEVLHRSTLNIDNSNRTVFHHIVDVAMSKGKTHAARYYMETVLKKLSEYPKELADIINFQDFDGETALTMAARCRSKRLVKILIDHGADPKIANHDGKSTEDYILEDERFRSSPVPTSRLTSLSFRNAHAASFPSATAGLPNYAYNPFKNDRPPLHYSVAGQKASTRCVNDVTSMLDSLAASFDAELRDKERDTHQAHALLTNIQAEILESQRAVTHLRAQAEGLPKTTQMFQDSEATLRAKMGRRYRLGWEKWIKDEESREARIRDTAGGHLILTPASATYHASEGIDEMQGQETTSAASRTQTNGKQRELPEDISDLTALYTDIPSDPQDLRQACESLRVEINQYQQRRQEKFDELVEFQADAGTGGRMADYRKLIGAGCGGVPPSEVDPLLGVLLETLEAEEPSSSSTAWSGSKPVNVS